MLPQLLVDVHHLFNRCVKASEKHVADNQKSDAGMGGIGVVQVKGLAKIGNRVDTRRLFAHQRYKCGFVRPV